MDSYKIEDSFRDVRPINFDQSEPRKPHNPKLIRNFIIILIIIMGILLTLITLMILWFTIVNSKVNELDKQNKELKNSTQEMKIIIQGLNKKDEEMSQQIVQFKQQLADLNPKPGPIPLTITNISGSFYVVSEFTYLSSADQEKCIPMERVFTRGIYRFEVKINRESVPIIGVQDARLFIPFGMSLNNPSVNRNNMYFQGDSAVVWQSGQNTAGNQHFKDGDLVAIELNMDSPIRTVHFFINGEQQPVFGSRLPNEIKVYIGDSVSLISFDCLSEPTAVRQKDEIEKMWII
ncbi:MAG: hypothetical protein EZS28_010058 [Streblomastix strix]|uniref:SPRY domain-containing protein n=1 Tax=Streblomastix strix TaxID=222440 RepID=A0A5J4WI82_9EUKA|nr:MAG: hypothetical protein EZS28_010058 [Streblomastix strix]